MNCLVIGLAWKSVIPVSVLIGLGCLLFPYGASAAKTVRLGQPYAASPNAENTQTLQKLIQLGVVSNPKLQKLSYQARAAWARIPQLRSLPDPTVSSNVYIHPIETAAGSLRANVIVAQKFPWWHRLSLQGKQAAVNAQAADQLFAAARLQVISMIESSYYQLYILGQKIRINNTNREYLKSLVRIANAKVSVGQASQGDVLRATLELSRLTVELEKLEQKVVGAKANLNALLNRRPDAPLPMPKEITPPNVREWKVAPLLAQAGANQPELIAAALREEAARVGIDVARLQRIPDVTLSAGWTGIEDNRPATNVVDVGRDAWAVGVSVNIPLWHPKYRAMEKEASSRLQAAILGRTSLLRRFEAAIADTLQEARSAQKIVEIYQGAILPQAKQTLETDSQSYQQGKVEFDRVISDFRNLVTLESAYHENLGRQAIAVARLVQLIGAPPQVLPPP